VGGSGDLVVQVVQLQYNYGISVVPFSATPIFDGTNSNSFQMTLTGNVTSSTFINGIDGQYYDFLIRQDASGLQSFTWPTTFKGIITIPITSLANTTAVQKVVFDNGTGFCYAIGLGIINL
jgi:hypothetical protein